MTRISRLLLVAPALLALAAAELWEVGADGKLSNAADAAEGASSGGAAPAVDAATEVRTLVSPPSTRETLAAFYSSVGVSKPDHELNEIMRSYSLDEIVGGLRKKYNSSIASPRICRLSRGEEAVAVEVVVPVPDVVEVRVDEPLVVDGQPQVAHGLQGELLPLAVLRDARARLRDHVCHVGVHERDDLRRHGPSRPEAR